jgi:DNA-directed DNA polymerase III PolC
VSYIPLRVQSHWSLLDGVPSVPELVSHAAALGLPALALTDRNALYGAVEFVAACRAAGIRPVIGAGLNLAAGRNSSSLVSTLILLAQNPAGYGNLCRLISLLQASPQREAALARGLALSAFESRTAGLIALSGGRAGPIDALLRAGDEWGAAQMAAELRDLFGVDRFCIELQLSERGNDAHAAALEALAARLGVRTVATQDARYLSREDAPRYRLLTAMRLGQRLAGLPPQPDYSFASPAEMERRFAAFPVALANSAAIAAECAEVLTLGQTHFPSPSLASGRTPPEELWALALAGARERYAALGEALEARLRKELDIINGHGYAAYFLVVADIVRFARGRGVPISPRGSASSSVVAYCLGIHDVDPLAHNLYFERFLSAERHDPPDIDLDLCSRRRDEVIAYVYERYGAEHVAMVCTYSTLRPRSALREAAKAFGLSEQRTSELARQLPWFWHGSTPAQLAAAHNRLLQSARDANERALLEASLALERTPHHLSIHPGGIVIAPGPITDLVPLQHSTKGLAITQFDSAGIERLGLVKIDLLGISALTVSADCVQLIRRGQPDFTLESIPADDEATARTLSGAQTIGCFQIESPGMRMTLREVSARSAADLIATLALYRPGPLKGGLKDAFVRRHLGQEAASYLHPALEPILRESHGVVLYQEQVLRIAHEVAGLSLGQADLLRRAMGKRSPEAMAQLRQQFVAGAQAASRLDAATAEQLWELMAAFAGYGFPKAHAAGYATLAYRMAYLKTHYPAEFMAARLAVWGGFYSPRVYMGEARRLGIALHPPHINHSLPAFALERDAAGEPHLYMGLDAVRELTAATIRRIIAARPFNSLDDLLVRAQPLHGEALNLVKVGALAGLGETRAMLDALKNGSWHGHHPAQLSLPFVGRDIPAMAHPVAAGRYGLCADAAMPSGGPPAHMAEPASAERAAWERELLGNLVSVHPLQLLATVLARFDLVHSDKLASHVGQVVTLAGMRVAALAVPYTRQPRLWLDLEDEAGGYQALLEGTAYQKYKALAHVREPLLVRGLVKRDAQGRIVVAAELIERLSPS